MKERHLRGSVRVGKKRKVRKAKAADPLEDEEKEPEAAEGDPPPDDEDEEVEDEEPGEVPAGMRKVAILAYTGQAIDVGYGPEVFDLAGLETPTQRIPLLLGHDDGAIAGYSTSIANTGTSLEIEGLVDEDEEEGRKFLSRADKGFPWQASIRVSVLEDEFVEDEEREINGRTVAGPFFHDKRSTLKETSFVSLGADHLTSARALADARNKELEAMADKAELDKAREQERTRAKEIRAAFPDDPGFCLDHIERGSTVEQAKLAYSDVLRERLAQAQAELASARKSGGTTSVPARRPTSRTAEGGGDAKERFMALVHRYEDAGLSRVAALTKVAREHEDLHTEWLEDHNSHTTYRPYGRGR